MIGKNSRYAALPVRTRFRPDGTEIRYLRPALLPRYEDVPVATYHRGKDNDRIDILAGQYYRQATGWWLIAAASSRPHPDDVLGDPGDSVAIPAIGVGGTDLK